MPSSGAHRRHFLGTAAAAPLLAWGGASGGSASAPQPGWPVLPAPRGPIGADAAYWQAVQGLYDVDRGDLANLENGYWGAMARPVLDEYLHWTARINRENTAYARNRMGPDWRAAREAVAAAAGFDVSEVALTRGATEALQLLIGNYQRLSPGDAVLCADLDYDSMQYAMESLARRRGVQVVRIDLPEPATRQAVIDAYAQALEAHPRLRLLLLTHVSHRTGLVLPVREIAALARQRGVDVILDAAHSWGHIDFEPRDLGIDFIGFNLHKWIGAPIGLGFLYIRKDRLADIDTQLGDRDNPADDIRSRVHTGTVNFAATLTLPAAVRLHRQIGTPAKAARLRHLRDLWVAEARRMPGVQILTPDEPGMSGGITSLRVRGHATAADAGAFAALLRDKYRVLTVVRTGLTRGPCLRVEPALYTRESEVQRLVDALRTETRGA
ncbi:selenocysteine lyase/cysteine desulfurase [Paracidovorax anthurii]|uniref:Selenocysteine lyase/cysteine desulfurase n=2 Tax=Paracidovorax anthurii TaxID=78229 RepID=A0A328YZC3_9BURK|nr:aminotransferase class V-fold PLP-dependent enzyme [Paracidovorax anthurii]RAR79160.1 selenocysteine lyase/cysteine desulfurase [Paracidovorax anthurii]